MKKIFFLTLLIVLTTINNHAQTPCVNGMVAGYPCENVDLWAFVPFADMGGGSLANDIWGWVDPNSNREFALVGKNTGTAFVEITDPANPVYLGQLPTHTNNSTWRDIKVYNNYAFIVSEAGGHGMQVFDLMQLLNVTSPQTFTETAHYAGFGGCHNVAIDENTGFAYCVGTSTFLGGLHVVDINNPLNPVLAGGFGDDGYTHDCQAVIYDGPDTNYQGEEIVFAANEDNFAIINANDKTDINLISSTTYSQAGYTHQCWLTPDHKYLIFGDELDEAYGYTTNTKTYVYDVSDLSAPVFVTAYIGPTTAIDHNLYTQGDLIFMSNYSAGLRIVDDGGIESGNLNEIAYFDCYPFDDVTDFYGTWSNYPYFPSGNVILTKIESGFFIVRPQIFHLTDAVSEVDCATNTAEFELNIPTALLSSTFDLDVNGLPGSPTITSSAINVPGTTTITISNLESVQNGITHFQIILSADYGEYIIAASVEKKEVNLIAKTFLEGPYDENTLVQSDELLQNGTIPLEEPYTDLGFNTVNGGGATTSQDILNAAGNDAVTDWIFVELRDGNDPTSIVATQAALLQKDGDIVNTLGNEVINFKCVNTDAVYVVLRHRNHLGVRSLNSFDIDQTIVTDFTSPSFDLLGGEKMVTLGNVRAMYAGDANNDGQVNPVDKNDYWRTENGQPYNYIDSKADFNLDGMVNPVDKNGYWRLNNSRIEQLE